MRIEKIKVKITLKNTNKRPEFVQNMIRRGEKLEDYVEKITKKDDIQKTLEEAKSILNSIKRYTIPLKKNSYITSFLHLLLQIGVQSINELGRGGTNWEHNGARKMLRSLLFLINITLGKVVENLLDQKLVKYFSNPSSVRIFREKLPNSSILALDRIEERIKK